MQGTRSLRLHCGDWGHDHTTSKSRSTMANVQVPLDACLQGKRLLRETSLSLHLARPQSQREAGRRYQDSLPGRFKHAARSRRWRERKAALAMSPMSPATSVAPSAAQAVTHQGSPTSASDAVLTVSSSMPAGRESQTVRISQFTAVVWLSGQSDLTRPAIPTREWPDFTRQDRWHAGCRSATCWPGGCPR